MGCYPLTLTYGDSMRFICRVLKGLFDGVVEVLFGGFIWKMVYILRKSYSSKDLKEARRRIGDTSG